MKLRELFTNTVQQLLELGEFSYPYNQITDTSLLKEFRASTPLGLLDVRFYSFSPDQLEIMFALNDEFKSTTPAKGDQFKVLSTVWVIIKNELPQLVSDQIQQIMFAADSTEPSRISLYKKLAPRIDNLLGSDWKYHFESGVSGELVGEVYFVWEKNADQQLMELGNFSYPVDHSFQANRHNYRAYTPLGDLEISFFKTKSMIEIDFTVDGKYSKTDRANKGEQFKILSTVWNVIATQLPKLVDNTTVAIEYSATVSEPGRVSLYRRVSNRLKDLLGSEWDLSVATKGGYNVYFTWRRETKSLDQPLLELGKFSYPVTPLTKLGSGGRRHEFVANTPLGKLEIMFYEYSTAIDVDFSIDGRFDKTNRASRGEQFKVLSTVWHVLSKELVKLINPNINNIRYSADAAELNRVSLYQKASDRLGDILGPDWKLSLSSDEVSVYFNWHRETKSLDQPLTELGNSKYTYYPAPAVQEGDDVTYAFWANTALGDLRVQLIQSSFIDFDSDDQNQVETIVINFTVNASDKLSGQAKQGEQFKILSTVWEIIVKELPKLVNARTIRIEYSADMKESSRIPIYQRVAEKLTKLLNGDVWNPIQASAYGRYNFIWTRRDYQDTFADANPNKYQQELLESMSKDDAKPIIKQFLAYAKSHLGLPQLPKINIIDDSAYSIRYRSFGGYNPDTKSINVMISNRHIQDLLRTLAHELVHYRQDLEHQLDVGSGQDGSVHENEANAQAAVIMRKWGKKYPKLFSYEALE